MKDLPIPKNMTMCPATRAYIDRLEALVSEIRDHNTRLRNLCGGGTLAMEESERAWKSRAEQAERELAAEKVRRHNASSNAELQRDNANKEYRARQQAERVINKLKLDLAAAVRAPAGWKLVPEKATPEILAAAKKCAERHLAGQWSNEECQSDQERADKSNAEYWSEMVAAVGEAQTTGPSAEFVSDEEADAAVQYIAARSLDQHTMRKLLERVWPDIRSRRNSRA
jgi:hypothetical protein